MDTCKRQQHKMHKHDGHFRVQWNGGYLTPSLNAIEVTLRGELREKLPPHLIKRCVAEHKTPQKSWQLLRVSFSLKVSLLNSVERVAVKKITTLHELNASVRTWIQTVR
eukprot:5221648-Amphidinium_carterae.1